MSEPDEIHKRVTKLERQMVDARKDTAAARVLAGGADRDVSDMQTQLRAHTRTLNALRETQLEHGERLSGVDGRLGGVEGRLGGVEGRLGGVEGRLDRLENKVDHGFSMVSVGMAQLTALLTPDKDKPEET